jgi:pterin-4a-carbinolamine dehydratase
VPTARKSILARRSLHSNVYPRQHQESGIEKMLRRTVLALKGDMAAVVLHDCNPQHGAPYNNHDRQMRDEEFQAFLLSVKGWTVLDSGAIHRHFVFDNYRMSFEWMGRLFAYGYISDKYAKVHWRKNFVEVTIYSGRFHGITRREARLAAFMNDQFNLLRKAHATQKEMVGVSNDVNPFRSDAAMGRVVAVKEPAAPAAAATAVPEPKSADTTK